MQVGTLGVRLLFEQSVFGRRSYTQSVGDLEQSVSSDHLLTFKKLQPRPACVCLVSVLSRMLWL